VTTLQQEIERFHEFATSKAAAGEAESLQELFDLWYAKHPTSTERSASLESLDRGLNDASAGRVRPAEDVLAELRRETLNNS